MKKLCAGLLLVAVFLTGCQHQLYEDDRVYLVDSGMTGSDRDQLVDWIDVEGLDPFLNKSNPLKLNENQFFLNRSKNDSAYFFQDDENEKNNPIKLLGSTARYGDVYRVDLKEKKREKILDNVPFIHKSYLDSEKKYLFFLGDTSFYYQGLKDAFSARENSHLASDIYNFFVSPLRQDKVYLDDVLNQGGSIFYPDNMKQVELFQTWETLFYKAILEKPYYFANQWRQLKEKGNVSESFFTVVCDADGKVARVIGKGLFVDAYKQQVLTSGNHYFGLTTMKNINQPNTRKKITEDFVYDAKFVHGGNFIWIGDAETPQKGISETETPYFLHFCDASGKELSKVPLSGSHILLSADGKTGFSSGNLRETIDLETGSILATRPLHGNSGDPELKKLLQNFSKDILDYYLAQPKSRQKLEDYHINLKFLDLDNTENDEGIIHSEKQRVHYEVQLNTTDINWASALSQVELQLVACTNEQAVEKNLAVQVAKFGGKWQIVWADLIDS